MADYDLFGALQNLAQGVVIQREDVDAAAAIHAATGQPLTLTQVVTACGPLPAYPAGLPRFVDSNPATDGWAIDAPGRHGP